MNYDLYVAAEDVGKILTVLLDHRQLEGDLKNQVIESIGENRSQYTFEIMADLSVIYATKMDGKYQELFFSKYMHHFVRNIQFLKEETLYKMLWSFVKADRLVVREDAYEWTQVKQAIQERARELSPKVMTNILVLSTVAKDVEATDTGELDFWDSLETHVILKMKEMDLGDLINLMWSAMEIEKGSKSFYRELEKEMTKRILKVKDEDY